MCDFRNSRILVIASEAKQSHLLSPSEIASSFVSLTPRNDAGNSRLKIPLHPQPADAKQKNQEILEFLSKNSKIP